MEPSGRNPILTPGVVDTSLTVFSLCHFSTRSRRTATSAQKRSVYEAYMIPKLKRVLYRLDDLIPLELGGVNVPENLWPQPLLQSLKKDRDENRLKKLVCANKMSLEEAQDFFRTNY